MMKDARGLPGKHEEKRAMMMLAQSVLPPLALHSFTLSGVLLATLGTIFLAYDLLGRENGPLRWFTLVMTCGIVSALIFVPVVTFVDLLTNSVDVAFILTYILAGGLMGFYTVILVELPLSDTRPPLFSWKGGLIGLALVLLFWLLGVLAGPQYALPALTLGLACALLTSTWQRLTWDPAQAGEELSASTPTSPGTEQLVARKPAHPRPHVFSRKGFLFGLLLVFIMWFAVFFTVYKDVIASLFASLSLALISGIICGSWRFISRKRLVLGLLFGFLLGFAFFFSANKDVIASLLESVPFALIAGVICGSWRFLNWEPPHPTPHLFSRKGFWSGLVAGFVPWLLYFLALLYPFLADYIGAIKGFEIMYSLCIALSEAGLFALANAVAGSIAQYTLWRANKLPHRTLGAIGLVLIVVALALQGVQPVIEILNEIK
jgi:hypothetical protein